MKQATRYVPEGACTPALRTIPAHRTLRALLASLALPAFLALPASCSKAGRAAEDSVPIRFGMAVPEAQTRASGELGQTELEGSTLGFGVFASYTRTHRYSESDIRPDFMYNDQVTYGGDGWTYSPLRYWPNGEGEADGTQTGSADNPHYVSFFAYAPYSAGTPSSGVYDTGGDGKKTPKGAADYCIPSFSRAQDLGDPWLIYRIIDQDNLDKQVDLLYADGSPAASLLDKSKQTVSGRVNVSFKHALACFGEKLRVYLDQKEDPDDPTEPDSAKEALERMNDVEMKLTDIHIDYLLTAKARLVLWNQGEPNWQPVLSQQMLERRTVTLLDTDTEFFSRSAGVTDDSLPKDNGKFCWQSSEGNGIFFIPIEVEGYPQTATISVSYDIYVDGVKDGEMSATKTVTVNLADYYDDFKKGGRKQNTVNITLTFEDK